MWLSSSMLPLNASASWACTQRNSNILCSLFVSESRKFCFLSLCGWVSELCKASKSISQQLRRLRLSRHHLFIWSSPDRRKIKTFTHFGKFSSLCGCFMVCGSKQKSVYDVIILKAKQLQWKIDNMYCKFSHVVTRSLIKLKSISQWLRSNYKVKASKASNSSLHQISAQMERKCLSNAPKRLIYIYEPTRRILVGKMFRKPEC